MRIVSITEHPKRRKNIPTCTSIAANRWNMVVWGSILLSIEKHPITSRSIPDSISNEFFFILYKMIAVLLVTIAIAAGTLTKFPPNILIRKGGCGNEPIRIISPEHKANIPPVRAIVSMMAFDLRWMGKWMFSIG